MGRGARLYRLNNIYIMTYNGFTRACYIVYYILIYLFLLMTSNYFALGVLLFKI